MQPSSPSFSQASQSNQQPCECAERINCTHTGGECECGEEAKPCSHTVRQRRSRRTCDCSGSGSQPCSHKPQHEGRIKRVKCRVRRAGCAMARCTAELAMLHLHWGLATECAPCRPRALTRRLCRRQQSDNELYRSNSFKFERFERSKDECATPLRKQVSICLPCSGYRFAPILACEIIYRIFYRLETNIPYSFILNEFWIRVDKDPCGITKVSWVFVKFNLLMPRIFETVLTRCNVDFLMGLCMMRDRS